MANKVQINRLTNANIYMDGGSFLGRAEEVTLPDVQVKMSEHKALGMVGLAELPSGIDKMEATIKWNSLYPEALGKAYNPFVTVQMQVRASLEQYGSQGRTAQLPVVVYLTGQFKNLPLGAYKQHENVEIESMLNVLYCKMEIDGDPVLEPETICSSSSVRTLEADQRVILCPSL
jgi:P2 family phage contractile tail tube protein